MDSPVNDFKPKLDPTTSFLSEIYKEIQDKRLKGETLNSIKASINASTDLFSRLNVDPNEVFAFAKDLYLTGVPSPAQPLGEDLMQYFL